ncbi:MAG: pyridoxine 5'-phosphate synthase [Planctomycetes bacterium]|nr:pyridoxine 5'-phosphate synthase [Planctomycetota bacterium]
MMKLGVNVDHIATVREARKTNEPDPVAAAVLAELGGADSIVVHLREDRRHIQDRDLKILRQTVNTRVNLEMAMSEEIAKIALAVKPDQVTFVPEKREEVTTEGGLNIIKNKKKVADFTNRFKKNKIPVSVFIDPDKDQLQAAKLAKVDMVELHTGDYANAPTPEQQQNEYLKLAEAAITARNMRVRVAAGHGLTYRNVLTITKILEIEELNIGHSIIARATMVGIERAVREMKGLINRK